MKKNRKAVAAAVLFPLLCAATVGMLSQPWAGAVPLQNTSPVASASSPGREQAAQTLKASGFPDSCFPYLPEHAVELAANAETTEQTKQYYVEDLSRGDGSPEMTPVEEDAFHKAERRAASGLGKDSGGTLLLSIYVLRTTDGSFGVIGLLQWTTMPRYRGDDYAALSHYSAASPEANRAECTYFYDYSTRIVSANAAGARAYSPWTKRTAVVRVPFEGLLEQKPGGYAAKIPVPKDNSVRFCLPNQNKVEIDISNFSALLFYSGNPAYPDSSSTIDHWLTYFHLRRFQLRFTDETIYMPYDLITTKQARGEATARSAGSVTISNPSSFDSYAAHHRFLYQPS